MLVLLSRSRWRGSSIQISRGRRSIPVRDRRRALDIRRRPGCAPFYQVSSPGEIVQEEVVGLLQQAEPLCPLPDTEPSELPRKGHCYESDKRDNKRTRWHTQDHG